MISSAVGWPDVAEAHRAVAPSRSTRLPSPCRLSVNRPSQEARPWRGYSPWLAVSTPQAVEGCGTRRIDGSLTPSTCSSCWPVTNWLCSVLELAEPTWKAPGWDGVVLPQPDPAATTQTWRAVSVLPVTVQFLTPLTA